MNKDFAAWWLERMTSVEPDAREWAQDNDIHRIAECAWEAAVKCEEEKRKQNGGPG